MLKKLVLIFALIFISQTNAEEKFRLYMPEALTLIKGSYRFHFDANMFNTSGDYDENGAETALSGNSSFQKIDTSAEGYYGVSDKFQIGAGFLFRQNESQLGGGNPVSNSGFESYYGRAKFYFLDKVDHHMSAVLEYRVATYENKNYQFATSLPANDLVLGDGGETLMVGGIYSYRRTSNHAFNLFGGYQMPGNELSNEFVYRLDTALSWENFALVLGGQGVYSMQDGTYSSNREARPFQSTGATKLFNAIDRQYFEPLVEMYYAFEKFRMGIYGRQRMSGQNTDQGTTLGLTLTFQSTQNRRNSRNKIKSFKEYNIEASIIKVSPRSKFVQIDKGLSEDIVKGMEFDIYETDYFGKNVLVAEAFAYEVGVKKAILKITKKVKNIKIKTGFTVRGKQGL